MGESSSDRLPLIDRVVSERLTTPGLNLVLGAAEVLSEGDLVAEGGTYYGSVMLTIDTTGVADQVLEPLDDAALARLAELMQSDLRVQRHLVELARLESSRRCGGLALDSCDLDIVFRVQPPELLIDIDVQARVATLAPVADVG